MNALLYWQQNGSAPSCVLGFGPLPENLVRLGTLVAYKQDLAVCDDEASVIRDTAGYSMSRPSSTDMQHNVTIVSLYYCMFGMSCAGVSYCDDDSCDGLRCSICPA